MMTTFRPQILIADDEEGIRFVLRELLTREGFVVAEARDGQEALDKAAQTAFDLAILDLKMPRVDGLSVLRELKRLYPRLIVLIITAHGSAKIAKEALCEGAYDYFTKPFDVGEIRTIVRRAIEKYQFLQQIDQLQAHLRHDVEFDRIVGSSPAMRDMFQLIERVAESDVTVLITGESGTGKELVASAIHARSTRAAEAMVKVNCVAIPETLLESELFGHERGSFTGAVQQKIGKVEMADRGSLFLDEIGDMSLALQGKLLRVLQEHEIERIGGNKTIKVDLRVICATNRDLNKAVEEKAFREDLLFRINVLPIYIPPLRNRREDIPLLIDHFIRFYSPKLNKQICGVSQDALDLMLNYPWPGNVRELENTIQRAMILSPSDVLTAECLSMSIRGQMTTHQDAASFSAPMLMTDGSPGESLASFLNENDFSIPLPEKIQRIVDKSEERLIRSALQQTGGHRQQTADLLGISRKSLHNKMVKFNLLGDATWDEE